MNPQRLKLLSAHQVLFPRGALRSQIEPLITKYLYQCTIRDTESNEIFHLHTFAKDENRANGHFAERMCHYRHGKTGQLIPYTVEHSAHQRTAEMDYILLVRQDRDSLRQARRFSSATLKLVHLILSGMSTQELTDLLDVYVHANTWTTRMFTAPGSKTFGTRTRSAVVYPRVSISRSYIIEPVLEFGLCIYIAKTSETSLREIENEWNWRARTFHPITLHVRPVKSFTTFVRKETGDWVPYRTPYEFFGLY